VLAWRFLRSRLAAPPLVPKGVGGAGRRNNPRTESDTCHYGNRHLSESSISLWDAAGKVAVRRPGGG